MTQSASVLMMKTLRTILLLAAVLLCLGACGRGKTAAEGTVRATDTIRYARNLHIAYYDDYVSVRIRDPWDTLRQRQLHRCDARRCGR